MDRQYRSSCILACGPYEYCDQGMHAVRSLQYGYLDESCIVGEDGAMQVHTQEP